MSTKKVLIILTVLVGFVWLASCQSYKQNQTVQPGQQVTLTGLMQQGTVTTMSFASYNSGLHPLGTALANYKLYCVTFEDSPVGAKGTADSSGKFSLTIKSFTPFGCFVLNSTDQHVADLLFAGLGTSTGTYSGSIMLSDNANVGTITVDPSTGMAVVNVAGVGGVTGNSITGTAFDPTGTWTFTCTSPAGDPVYSCPSKDVPSSLYLDRISGIFSSDGKRHYGMGVWNSQANYTVCGSVEGVAATTGTTGQGPSGTTVTLVRPDGPLQFAYDNIWQAAFSANIMNTNNACNAGINITCGAVTNVAGWGGSDKVPFTPGNCQQMCYADGYYQIQRTSTYCIENRNYLWGNMTSSQLPSSAPTTDTNTSFIDFDGHNPAARIMFGELIYSSNTSASEVYTDYRTESVYDPVSNQSYNCSINEITKLAVSQINTNTLVGTVDQSKTLSGPPQCTSTAIPNNYVVQDISNPMHMMFKLTR
ncbi:MAG: hypothetical protein M1381_03795 [Deltaproteobacteria bacterium]|nr:hypothetical protein [Deltaproteobacteria bacterium]MCL5792492.1 hypothetical protein [Deltaproteobacteria bacterium]